jgi:hypothetical protein
MKRAWLPVLEWFCTLALLSAPLTCVAQYVTTANLPCAAGICPPAGPNTATNAVFKNIFVFLPATPGETWDQHLATYIQNNPQYGPQGGCMDGTTSPCLQGLTSEAIDNYVQALVNSNYFQAMNNSYGIGVPTFTGELPLVPTCAWAYLGPAATGGTAIGYWSIVNFINCQLPSPTFPAPQLNLIFAPDLPTPTNINPPPDLSSEPGGQRSHCFSCLRSVNKRGKLPDEPGFRKRS